jgi:hypothetical protein
MGAANEWYVLKKALYYGFYGRGKAKMITTQKKNVCRFATVCNNFASTAFHGLPR